MAAAVAGLAVDGQLLCGVCGGPYAIYLGFFEGDPATQKLIGAPKGKVRLAAYLLCEACRQVPQNAQRIEDAILRPLEERRELAARN